MRFDIVLPTIGRPSLVDAIQSVLNQDYQDWKLWVYEQGSFSDFSSLIKNGCLPFAYWQDPVVRNDSGTHARNAMIQTGTSQWITYIDDDDIWLPNHLSTIASLTEANPDVTMIRTAGQSFSWKHKSPRSSKLVRKLGAVNSTDILTVGMAHTRNLFKLTQGFQPCDNHDKLLWKQMLSLGGKPAVSDAVTFQFER